MKFPQRVIFCLFAMAASMVSGDYVLPPGVAESRIAVSINGVVQTQTSTGMTDATSTDTFSASFADQDFFQPLNLEVSQGDHRSAMGGEVSLNRVANGQVVEYVLAGSFRPETHVAMTPGFNIYANADGTLNLTANFTLTKTARMTVEIFLVGDQHYGSLTYTLGALDYSESYSLQGINGEISRSHVSTLMPGQASLAMNVDAQGFSWFSGLSMPPRFERFGGDLEYLVRITLDPDEDFELPMPTLRIGAKVGSDYRMELGNLQPGWSYRVERSPSMDEGSWGTVSSLTAEQPNQVYFLPLPPGWDRVFYRLVRMTP